MNNVSNMGVTLHLYRTEKIYVLKYADDVVLIATDAEVLQKVMRALEQFCADNRLTVNTHVFCKTEADHAANFVL